VLLRARRARMLPSWGEGTQMITITHARLRQAASLIVGLTCMIWGVSLGLYLIDQGAPSWQVKLSMLGITFSGVVASAFGFCGLYRRSDDWEAAYMNNTMIILVALLSACGLAVATMSLGHVGLFILSVWCVLGLMLLLALVNTCSLGVLAFHLMFERVVEEEADE